MNRRRHARLLASVLTVAAVIAVAPSATLAAHPRLSLLSAESHFMCTSCGEPLDEAQSLQASSERQFLGTLVGRGMRLSQIERVMVSNYGPSVLAKPPAHGFSLLIYILPPVLLLIGLATLLYTLPRWRARSRRAAAQHPEGPPPLAPEDAARLDEDLARFI